MADSMVILVAVTDCDHAEAFVTQGFMRLVEEFDLAARLRTFDLATWEARLASADDFMALANDAIQEHLARHRRRREMGDEPPPLRGA